MSETSAPADAARRRAFAEIVEPEIEVMLRVARSITGSTADAEDLVQESLVRAFRAIDRFDGRHPRAWLLTIVRNTNVNMHRRRRPIAVDDWELIHASRPAFGSVESPAAEEVYVADELDGALQVAISGLDPKFRSALVLVDVHDLSYAEAAAVLDVPVGTVMSRLSRARERVRRALGPTFTTTRGEQS
ncbi:RNA polymerase sigma factor [Mycobacterium cookii]|uniref:RNA polymerase sigma factor n=1 Tax=Nocardioides furvisabuli TaxID=375542 RepID=A0ABN2XDE9_9ACTN|nr:RNA polymerase sigma factor [Nocardioides furvisabuli]